MILFVDKDTTLFRSSSIRYRGWLYGKSYMATALGYEACKACKAGMRVMYANASKLMGALKIAKNKGTIES